MWVVRGSKICRSKRSPVALQYWHVCLDNGFWRSHRPVKSGGRGRAFQVGMGDKRIITVPCSCLQLYHHGLHLGLQGNLCSLTWMSAELLLPLGLSSLSGWSFCCAVPEKTFSQMWLELAGIGPIKPGGGFQQLLTKTLLCKPSFQLCSLICHTPLSLSHFGVCV